MHDETEPDGIASGTEPDGVASETEPENFGPDSDPAKGGDERPVPNSFSSEAEPENSRRDLVSTKDGLDKPLPGNGSRKTGASGSRGRSPHAGEKRRRNGTGGENVAGKPNGPSENPSPVQTRRKKSLMPVPGGLSRGSSTGLEVARRKPRLSGPNGNGRKPGTAGADAVRESTGVRRPSARSGTGNAESTILDAREKKSLTFPLTGKPPETVPRRTLPVRSLPAGSLARQPRNGTGLPSAHMERPHRKPSGRPQGPVGWILGLAPCPPKGAHGFSGSRRPELSGVCQRKPRPPLRRFLEPLRKLPADGPRFFPWRLGADADCRAKISLPEAMGDHSPLKNCGAEQYESLDKKRSPRPLTRQGHVERSFGLGQWLMRMECPLAGSRSRSQGLATPVVIQRMGAGRMPRVG
jgi:hypothetical protein